MLLAGERKSVEPIAARVAPGEVQQLHHFVSASPWATEPLEAELVCEERAAGERKFYPAGQPAETPLRTLAAAIKARWVWERAHQQMKEELGLDHPEGRSWRGLHHNALLCRLAFAFLQHLRLGGKRAARHRAAGRPPAPSLPEVRRRFLAAPLAHLARCPGCGRRLPRHPQL